MEDTQNTSAPKTANPEEEAKLNAMLAWIFAPITSYVWRNDANSFVRAHARESFYLGLANAILGFALFAVHILFNFLFKILLGSLFYGFWPLFDCFWGLLWILLLAFTVVPRIVGIVKANDMQTWEVPYVTEFLSKYIKL